MSYAQRLQTALKAQLGSSVVFLPGWDRKYRGIGWRGKGGAPVALMVHHTAAAATDSTNPKHPGNRKGANQGQIDYVNHHFKAPCSNFTLDRDGTVYVNTAYPCWHSGQGSFKHFDPYDSLNIPDNQFADYGMGVECVSKGAKPDFTDAMKWSLGYLAVACKEASGWKGFFKRLPNHRTWAPTRKVDSRYSVLRIRKWAANALKKGK